ncbi:GAS2-like protein 2 [Tupaia chinensis]|uniref:GAS2-like protein 2 n=1 Tax=Tupaia chinensis TaxID=246437 RepID=L9KG83_TUPCH|nr:GAS2-like protein 2 [Tupaia chinensis]
MSQPRGHRRPKSLGPPVRSIRPFKSSMQYLEAMKEDLAEWLRDLYGLDIDADNFLQVLETGLVLCRHANAVTKAALAFLAEAPAQAQRILVPRAGVFCNGAAQPGTFQARDNVSNFIQWCRHEMGIQEVLMFETEDLVLRKNVKNVVLCLLELGRRAWRFGVAAPTLVQLEEEIDEELRQELALPRPEPPPPVPPTRRPCHFRNLDQMVQSLVSHCRCPVQFSMVKVSEGKYRVGDSSTLIFIRILRSHVMVRVGGGWDTLGHYLDKHDPCRCTSLCESPESPLPVVLVGELRVSRSQERSLTSLRRQLPAGDSPPSPQPSPTYRRQEPQCTLSGKRESRSSPERPRGRTPTSWVPEQTDTPETHTRIPTPQKLQVPEATTKGTPARGPSSLPRPPSPAKPLGPRLPLQGEAEGAFCQLGEPTTVRSPSPVKGLTKIPVRLSLARTPTPGRSFPGTATTSAMTELGRGPVPIRAITGDLAGSRHVNCSAKMRQGGQVPGEAAEPWGPGLQEREGKYTPRPPGRTEEQAVSCSLEEEILANMKLLDVGGARSQDTGSGVIPRSGVYVPSLGGRWPEPGGPYDKVIQELAQGPPPLLKVDLRAWKATLVGSSKPAVASDTGSQQGKLGARGSSGPKTKPSPRAKSPRMSKAPSLGGQDCSGPPTSASPEAPTHLPSDPSCDKAKTRLGKGKRTLRKPQRVPSIYKLKLRPRMRPRRDHRPEKQPSRIPKPLAYLHLGRANVPSRSRLLRAARGCKGGGASCVNGVSAGEQEEEKEKEPTIPPEGSPQALEGLEPEQLDQTPLPAEETWV